MEALQTPDAARHRMAAEAAAEPVAREVRRDPVPVAGSDEVGQRSGRFWRFFASRRTSRSNDSMPRKILPAPRVVEERERVLLERHLRVALDEERDVDALLDHRMDEGGRRRILQEDDAEPCRHAPTMPGPARRSRRNRPGDAHIVLACRVRTARR